MHRSRRLPSEIKERLSIGSDKLTLIIVGNEITAGIAYLRHVHARHIFYNVSANTFIIVGVFDIWLVPVDVDLAT